MVVNQEEQEMPTEQEVLSVKPLAQLSPLKEVRQRGCQGEDGQPGKNLLTTNGRFILSEFEHSMLLTILLQINHGKKDVDNEICNDRITNGRQTASFNIQFTIDTNLSSLTD